MRASDRRHGIVVTALAVMALGVLATAHPAAADPSRGLRVQAQSQILFPYKMDRWSPTESSATVEYPDGRYELRGDGVGTPYHWVWVPKAAPPAPAPGTTPYGPAEGVQPRSR